MTELKTGVVNLGPGMIYKIIVPDAETPNSIVISWTDADGTETTEIVDLGGI